MFNSYVTFQEGNEYHLFVFRTWDENRQLTWFRSRDLTADMSGHHHSKNGTSKVSWILLWQRRENQILLGMKPIWCSPNMHLYGYLSLKCGHCQYMVRLKPAFCWVKYSKILVAIKHLTHFCGWFALQTSPALWATNQPERWLYHSGKRTAQRSSGKRAVKHVAQGAYATWIHAWRVIPFSNWWIADKSKVPWLVVWNINFIFPQYLGWWSNLTNIFQGGWNYQLVPFWKLILFIDFKKHGDARGISQKYSK